jgi:hypothetical protein
MVDTAGDSVRAIPGHDVDENSSLGHRDAASLLAQLLSTSLLFTLFQDGVEDTCKGLVPRARD